MHFFGRIGVDITPDTIALLDNNGAILLVCRAGKTIDQLEASGIKTTESQIRLLQEWRLLRKEDNVFNTNFPILDYSETQYLRKITKEVAIRIGSKLKEEVLALKEAIISQGHEKNAYTIFFSYVLDNLVWDEIKEVKRIFERKITTREPFWAGFLWAIYPPKEFSCGTNSSTYKGVSLYLNWSETGGKLIFSVYSDTDAYTKLFKDVVKHGKVKNKKTINVFKPYNICDDNGNLTIPIIVETNSCTLHKFSKKFAQKIAKEFLNLNALNVQDLQSKLSIRDRNEVIIIAYHELMWEIMNYFESQDIIRKPIVFTNPGKAELKDLANLMFVVKQNSRRF